MLPRHGHSLEGPPAHEDQLPRLPPGGRCRAVDRGGAGGERLPALEHVPGLGRARLRGAARGLPRRSHRGEPRRRGRPHRARAQPGRATLQPAELGLVLADFGERRPAHALALALGHDAPPRGRRRGRAAHRRAHRTRRAQPQKCRAHGDLAGLPPSAPLHRRRRGFRDQPRSPALRQGAHLVARLPWRGSHCRRLDPGALRPDPAPAHARSACRHPRRPRREALGRLCRRGAAFGRRAQRPPRAQCASRRARAHPRRQPGACAQDAARRARERGRARERAARPVGRASDLRDAPAGRPLPRARAHGGDGGRARRALARLARGRGPQAHARAHPCRAAHRDRARRGERRRLPRRAPRPRGDARQSHGQRLQVGARARARDDRALGETPRDHGRGRRAGPLRRGVRAALPARHEARRGGAGERPRPRHRARHRRALRRQRNARQGGHRRARGDLDLARGRGARRGGVGGGRSGQRSR